MKDGRGMGRDSEWRDQCRRWTGNCNGSVVDRECHLLFKPAGLSAMEGCRWGIWPHARQVSRATCTHVLCSPTDVYGGTPPGAWGHGGAQSSLPQPTMCPSWSLGDGATCHEQWTHHLQTIRALFKVTWSLLHHITWVTLMLIRLFSVFMHLLFIQGTARYSLPTRNLHAAFLICFMLPRFFEN